ncbi:MAG TPA: MaoC family dehydratase [Ramlibacter sp.]|nr:MaoC family dehydratase [Ramlibacter sp.]
MMISVNFEDLPGRVGQELGRSEWVTLSQQRIAAFADAIGDHQWIHVDPERAKAGPFGTTIAHGFLTLSLIPQFIATVVAIRNTRLAVNYGLNRVRFTAPVPVDSRLRGAVQLLACEPVEGPGLQLTWQVTVEREGGDKPVCIAEFLTRCYA